LKSAKAWLRCRFFKACFNHHARRHCGLSLKPSQTSILPQSLAHQLALQSISGFTPPAIAADASESSKANEMHCDMN